MKRDDHREPTVSARIPAVLRTALRKIAKDQDRTVSQIIRKAAQQYLYRKNGTKCALCGTELEGGVSE